MNSPYPKCRNVDTLVSLASNTVVRISGWGIKYYSHDDSLYLVDYENKSIKYLGAPDSVRKMFATSGDATLYGYDTHVRVQQVDDNDYYSWARNRTEIYHYDPKPAKCDCGAAHTSFPTHHSDWCNSSNWL